ncbi:hypothetical protein EES37_04140 [Streptomyces sp. ADI91-18]|nr:hypothetical protein EES37_04140 [Streptomyces sp. ADI91-18]
MQNTDTSRPSRVKVTRIQKSCFHTCIRQPAAGVAETSSAEVSPRSNTTRPPETVYPFTSPAAGSSGCLPWYPADGFREDFAGAGEEAEGLPPEAEAEAEAAGEAGGDGEAEGEESGGSDPCVEDDSGRVVSGTASGGS